MESNRLLLQNPVCIHKTHNNGYGLAKVGASIKHNRQSSSGHDFSIQLLVVFFKHERNIIWSGEKRVSASNYWPPAKVSGDQFSARQCQRSKKIAQSECVLQRSHQIQQMSGLFQLAQRHCQHCSGVPFYCSELAFTICCLSSSI